MLSAGWRYRQFIRSSIRTDYRARFARSKLGALWMVIHPLVNAAILALVLAEVMSARMPGMTGDRFAFALYLLAGMLAWSLFSEVITRCLTIFIDNGNLLKKLVFPRICLPLIVTGTALLNNVLLFVAILAIFALLGHPPSLHLAWIPVLMTVPLALGLGLGLLLGVFNVFVRDIAQAVPVVLQLAFWFTPIAYLPALLPPYLSGLLRLNPMTPVVQSYQNVMLYGTAPVWSELAWVGALALALLVIVLFMFRRASSDLVDAL
jgi:lipopolysaccharide transport system permease protein